VSTNFSKQFLIIRSENEEDGKTQFGLTIKKQRGEIGKLMQFYGQL